MTPIAVGGAPGYLLGPLMTDPAHRSKGAGRHLVQKAIAAAKAAKAEFVLLVGDEPYYGALGFKQVPPGDIVFPGPVDPARILVHAEPDAIGRIKGMVGPRR
jgi:predicted N-acetyltransferase YhbS